MDTIFLPMTDNFDLFGNPINGPRAAGRPEHVPSEENIIFVMVLLASGQTNKEVAETLGITVPTLRKHYFHLLRKQEVMLDRLKTKLQVKQIQEALSGNASALSSALKQLETAKVSRAEKRVSKRSDPKPTAAPKLGKKEERKAAAHKVTGKFAPPEPPRLVVDNK